jgi:predicted phage terminase large subunit-like protein
VSKGQIQRLLINVPPRHTKSLIVSVLWPCWEWARWPELRYLFASYAESLAVRDSVKSRRLIQSAWYQRAFGHVFQFAGDQNLKGSVENDRGGHRIALGTGGSATGQGGDRLICDDPHNVTTAESDDVRKGVLDWHDQVWSTRANDPKTTARVIVGQRIHQDDLSGHVLEQGGWEHLSLPAEWEGDKRVTSIGWSDPRTELGALLWPERIGPTEIAATKVMLGSWAYSAQYQQRPSPAGGGILARHWWRYWEPKGMDLRPVAVRLPDGSTQQIRPIELPADFDEMLASFDCAFKDLATSDYVAGQVWAAKKADRFLLDSVRERMSFTRTLAAVKALREKWPAADKTLIEEAANGEAILDTLRHEVPGLIGVKALGGKQARVQAVSPQVEAGNVFLPHPALASWVDVFIEECAAFPSGKNDDMVDACSQALNRLSNGLRYGLTVFLDDISRDTAACERMKMAADRAMFATCGAVPKIPVAPAGGRPTCPECSAVCCAPVSSGGWRCSSCGNQFGEPGFTDPKEIPRNTRTTHQ